MYDVVIIGAGMAGLTAGIYAARANLRVKILEEKGFGGQIVNSLNVENYPGFSSISGFALAKLFYDQAISLGCDIAIEKVIEIKDHSVITNKQEYNAKTIIIASGLNVRKLGLEKEDILVGRGISYCATCDGNFYKDKNVLVVGGGNTALEDALFLSNIAKKVYLMIRRDEFRGNQVLVDKLENLDNVEIIKNALVKSLIGDDCLKGVTYQQQDREGELDIDGLFVAIGRIPDSDYLKNIVKCDKDGYVLSEECETSKDNIFVAGDIRTKNLRQVITAASDGALAATKAIKYLLENK